MAKTFPNHKQMFSLQYDRLARRCIATGLLSMRERLGARLSGWDRGSESARLVGRTVGHSKRLYYNLFQRGHAHLVVPVVHDSKFHCGPDFDLGKCRNCRFPRMAAISMSLR